MTNNLEGGQDIAVEKTPAEEIEAKMQETQSFIKSLQSMPQTERTVKNLEVAQAELTSLLMRETEIRQSALDAKSKKIADADVSAKYTVKKNAWSDHTESGIDKRGSNMR